MWIVKCPKKDFVSPIFENEDDAFEAAESHNDATGHNASVFRLIRHER